MDGLTVLDLGIEAPADGVLVQLNVDWRLVDDPLQWILQRRRKPRERGTDEFETESTFGCGLMPNRAPPPSKPARYGWDSLKFLTTRIGLLMVVREFCGPVGAGERAYVDALPEYHRPNLPPFRKTSKG